jgi:hypothetical protein
MSVIKAILFYSKHDGKSVRMKEIIEELQADVDVVSVDSPEVRERLLEDEKFGIDEVPAILLLYSTGQHRVYVSDNLHSWFEKLLENITEYNRELQSVPEDAYTPIQQQPSPAPAPAAAPREHTITPQINPARAAMISEHIRGADPTTQIASDPNIQPSRKEVKKENTPSAAELAKQMAEQREKFEEKVEDDRPFM